MLKITSQLIFDELTGRGVEVEIFDLPAGILRYRQNQEWQYTYSCRPETTSILGVKMCDEKILTTKLAADLGVPTPATCFCDAEDVALNFLNKYKKIVVKPLDASHGNGVTINVDSIESLRKSYEVACAFSKTGQVILQQQVQGDDLRVLIINGKLAAACQRIPARVFGDGRKTIYQLIEQENSTNNLRDYDYKTQMNVIDITAAKRYLKGKIDTYVPKTGEEVRVVGAANMGTGGEALDVTCTLPQQIIDDAIKITKTLKIMACGVDFMYDPKTQNYYFIEANSTPSFGLHHNPTHGQSHNVTAKFVDAILSD